MNSDYVRGLMAVGIPRQCVELLAKLWLRLGLKRIKLKTLELSLEEKESHGNDA